MPFAFPTVPPARLAVVGLEKKRRVISRSVAGDDYPQRAQKLKQRFQKDTVEIAVALATARTEFWSLFVFVIRKFSTLEPIAPCHWTCKLACVKTNGFADIQRCNTRPTCIHCTVSCLSTTCNSFQAVSSPESPWIRPFPPTARKTKAMTPSNGEMQNRGCLLYTSDAADD